MNISTAIERLSLFLDPGMYDGNSKDIASIKLAIEALKAIELCRKDGRLTRFFKLPSETKE